MFDKIESTSDNGIMRDLRGQSYKREFTLARQAIDEEARTVRVSFSSEKPVDRYGELEILDHSNGSVSLERLASGAAVLLNHDRDKQIGVVDSAEIGEDKRGYAVLRFSKSQLGEEVYQDVKDGIRTLVSVSYNVHEARAEKMDGKPAYRVTSWEPMEISIVSIPADSSVGVGRQIEDKMNKQLKLDADPPNKGGGAATEPDAARAQIEVQERKMQDLQSRHQADMKILSLANEHGVPMKEAQRFITDKKPVEDFVCHILETRSNAQPTVPNSGNLGMNEREVKRYSVLRAIRCAASGENCYEREISQEVEKRLGRTHSGDKGFLVPTDVASQSQSEHVSRQELDRAIGRAQRTLGTFTGPVGGYTVGTDLLSGSMIELLRNMPIIAQLGATQMSGLVGNVAIPKQAGGATAYWLPENGEGTTSTQSFGQIALTPHRLAAETAYTKQLLAQSSLDIESFVRMDLMMVLAIAKDQAALRGTGADGQPLGLLNYAGLSTIAFGAAPSWAKVVEFEQKVEEENAVMLGAPQWLTTPAVKAKWKTTLKATGVSGYLSENNQANGYGLTVSNQFAASTNLVVFGVFPNIILADWEGLDIVVDPYTLASKNQVRTVVNLLTDVQVRQPKGFVISTDSGAQ